MSEIKETQPEVIEEIIVEEIPEIPEIPEPEIPLENRVDDGKLEKAVWKNILSELSRSAPLISGILSDSNAYINGQFLLIDTENTQFAELINGKNNIYREKLRKAIETVLGRSFKLGPYRKKAAVEDVDPLSELKQKLKDLEIPSANR